MLAKSQAERHSMEKAPGPASTTTTKASTAWQDRAMNAPVLPLVAKTMPPPLSEEALTECTQALGAIFTRLIDEATTMSALKSQEHNAKKRAERRASEYQKSKAHHDKFPSIKDSQTVSKTEEEKELKVISAKVNEKQDALQMLATEAVEKLIPTLLARGGGNPAEQHELQNRIANLEKKCEDAEENKRVMREQARLLAEQRKVIQTLEAKHQALSDSIGEKHVAFTKTLSETRNQFTTSVKNAQGQATSTFSRVNGMSQELKDSQQAIENLKKDFSLIKGDIAKISSDNTPLSAELKTHAHNIQTLFSRVEEIDTIRTELKSIEAKSQAFSTHDSQKRTDDEINKIKKNCTELLNHCVELAKAQKNFRDNGSTLSSRVDELENNEKRHDLAKFDARLQKVEDTHARLGDAADIRKDIEGLKDRVKQVERLPQPVHPLSAKPSSTSLDARVDFLEKVTQSLKSPSPVMDSRVTALEQASNSQKNLHNDIDKRVKSVEISLSSLRSREGADFKRQISALEVQQRTATSIPTTSNAQPSSEVALQPHINQISSRLDKVQNRVQVVEDAQEEHEKLWTGILEENIKEVSQQLQDRLSTLEASQTQLSNRIEQAGFGNDSVEETASKVSAIFKANPESLPSRPATINDTQKAALINEAITNVIGTLKGNPDILPFPTERSTFIIHGILNQGLVPMQTSLEATNLSLGNLQARVDNINTLDLSRHALGQLYELHPDLARIEATIGDFKTAVAGFKADTESQANQFDELSKNVNGLEGAVRNLEASIQDRQTAEAMTEHYQELRKEVDGLTDDGITISRNVKTLTTTLDTLVQDVTSLNQEVRSLNEGNKSNMQIIADQLAELQADIDEKLAKTKEAPPRPSPAVSQRSNTTNGTARGPRPASSSSIGNRQPSVSSASNKKRKIDVLSAKTNGARPSHSGSPRAKRTKKAFGDDSEADPDFEDIPEPGVSSDEE